MVHVALHLWIEIMFSLSLSLSFIEGSLEVTFRQYGQLKSRGEKSQKREDQKKEDADARKGRKVAKHCVFQWLRWVEK